MGASASAELRFGIALEAEGSLYFTTDEDYNYVDYRGNPIDTEEYDDLDPGDLGEFLALRAGLTDAHYKERRKLEEAAPVEVAFGGHCECSQPCLVLKGYEALTYWGAEPITLPTQPSKDEIDAAVTFCDENGLPDFSKATWLLIANYG